MTQRADSPVFLDPDEHSSELAQIPPRGLSRQQKETLPALSLALSVTILPPPPLCSAAGSLCGLINVGKALWVSS